MKIKVKNLGALDQAEFELSDFTIICGNNNTGKTYATYALFGFLSYWHETFLRREYIDIEQHIFDKLLRDGSVKIDIKDYIKNNALDIVKEVCNKFTKTLSSVFASNQNQFTKSEFQICIECSELEVLDEYEERLLTGSSKDFLTINKIKGDDNLTISLLISANEIEIPSGFLKNLIGHSLKKVIFLNLFPKPFIASAERTGAAIFRKELNFARNRLVEEMGQMDKTSNPRDLLLKVYNDYAKPVKKNVEFTRQLESIVKNNSFIAKSESYLKILSKFSDIIGGNYTVTKNDDLYFSPKGKSIKLTMDESSSAVRSLLDIGFYLKHIAEKGDLLIIDEPELNLHPENQRRVARLLAQLVNLGIKVFITTHSDYIIKELNILIMLKQEKSYLNKIAEKEGYHKDEFLSSNSVKLYIGEEALVKLDHAQRRTRCQTLTPAHIDSEFGIEARSFDSTIDAMNRIQEAIVWGVDNE